MKLCALPNKKKNGNLEKRAEEFSFVPENTLISFFVSGPANVNLQAFLFYSSEYSENN